MLGRERVSECVVAAAAATESNKFSLQAPGVIPSPGCWASKTNLVLMVLLVLALLACTKFCCKDNYTYLNAISLGGVLSHPRKESTFYWRNSFSPSFRKQRGLSKCITY